jgi:sn-glycerol 3-phosphate transport system permease protein
MKKSKGSQIIFAILGFFLAAVILSPLIYCLSTSFMTEQEIYASKLVPSRIGLDNYRSALRVAPIFRFILNSTIVACTCTFMQLLTGALAGYAFGSLKFRGRKVLFYLILATMMIPGNAIIIANYLTMAKLQALDSYRALILPYMTSAFCIFNMRQAFLSLPSDLQEAATIDGCNSLQFFCACRSAADASVAWGTGHLHFLTNLESVSLATACDQHHQPAYRADW